MQVELKQIVEERSGSIVSQRMAWAHAAERLSSTGLETEAIAQLLRACSEPTQAEQLAALFQGQGMPDYLALRGMVDESDFSFSDWCLSLCLYAQWQEQRGRAALLDNAAGYVHCSALADSHLPLPDRVEGMLKQYGVED